MNLINKNIISWKRRQKTLWGQEHSSHQEKGYSVYRFVVGWSQGGMFSRLGRIFSLTDKVSCPLMDPEQSWPSFLSSHETGLPKAQFHQQLFHLKKTSVCHTVILAILIVKAGGPNRLPQPLTGFDQTSQ